MSSIENCFQKRSSFMNRRHIWQIGPFVLLLTSMVWWAHAQSAGGTPSTSAATDQFDVTNVSDAPKPGTRRWRGLQAQSRLANSWDRSVLGQLRTLASQLPDGGALLITSVAPPPRRIRRRGSVRTSPHRGRWRCRRPRFGLGSPCRGPASNRP